MSTDKCYDEDCLSFILLLSLICKYGLVLIWNKRKILFAV